MGITVNNTNFYKFRRSNRHCSRILRYKVCDSISSSNTGNKYKNTEYIYRQLNTGLLQEGGQKIKLYQTYKYLGMYWNNK